MSLLRFFMICVLTAASAELFELQTIRSCLFVLRRHVIAALTITALQYNVIAWHKSYKSYRSYLSYSSYWSHGTCGMKGTYATYSTTSDTVPAPTVRPPSRIAKRRPFSMAIGAINSISICTLSPGMTISMPSGILMVPVTSVVRM